MSHAHVVQAKNTKNVMGNNSKKPGKYSEEKLKHFNCYKCKKWWTIEDTQNIENKLFCTWCGLKQTFVEEK